MIRKESKRKWKYLLHVRFFTNILFKVRKIRQKSDEDFNSNQRGNNFRIVKEKSLSFDKTLFCNSIKTKYKNKNIAYDEATIFGDEKLVKLQDYTKKTILFSYFDALKNTMNYFDNSDLIKSSTHKVEELTYFYSLFYSLKTIFQKVLKINILFSLLIFHYFLFSFNYFSKFYMFTVLSMEIKKCVNQCQLLALKNDEFINIQNIDFDKKEELSTKYLIQLIKNHIKMCSNRWLCYISLVLLEYIGNYLTIINFFHINHSLWTFFYSLFIILILGSENELNFIYDNIIIILRYVKLIKT